MDILALRKGEINLKRRKKSSIPLVGRNFKQINKNETNHLFIQEGPTRSFIK